MSRSGRKRTCACVKMSLPDDRRLKRIPFGARRGQALGAWIFALCHSRQREAGGFCPTEALRDFAGDEAIQDLIDAGIVTRGKQGGVAGVVVVNYAEVVNRLPWDVPLLAALAASEEPKATHGRRAS